MSLTITPAQQEDIPTLIDLVVEAFGESTRSLAEKEFATGWTPNVRCAVSLLVARWNGAIVGLAGLMEDYSYIDTYCLCWVTVRPSFQGRGIGTELIQHALQQAATLIKREAGSVILVTKQTNVAYYHRLGFSGSTPIHGYMGSQTPHFLLSQQITSVKT
jgi:predicted N-acetyltransferase YhbS